MEYSELLEPAVRAARAASSILRTGFGKAMQMRNKDGRHNLVTEYDVRCEQEIMSILSSATPGCGFLAEESGGHEAHSDITWIIDPLDGTVNFAHGIPIFCVSIAATVSGIPACGVIIHPLLNEEFTTVSGSGAFLNGERLKVSSTETLDESIVVTGFPYNVANNPGDCLGQFRSVIEHGIPVRRLGSAALDLAYIAAGRFDGYWEVRLNAWDMAAGALLVREAGGLVTDYEGADRTIDHGSIIATNGKIHGELKQALEGTHHGV